MRIRQFKRAAVRAAAKAATISLLVTCAQPAFATDYNVSSSQTASATLYTLTGSDSLVVTNTGSINATSGAAAISIDSAATGVTIDNSGTIATDGGLAINSDSAVSGTGITNQAGALISAPTTAIYFDGSFDGSLDNFGTIEVSGSSNQATAIYVNGDLTGTLNNGGRISAGGSLASRAVGILISGDLAGTMTNASNGTISASANWSTSSMYATGIWVQGGLVDTLENAGTITAGVSGSTSSMIATGILIDGDLAGTLSNTSTGTISASAQNASSNASAYGIKVSGMLDAAASLTNSGAITAQATGYNRASAYGINMFGMAADASLINNAGGSITATATATSGGASAYGISTGSLVAGAIINNNGTITAQADGNSWAYAYGISMSDLGAGANLANGGTITANASGSSSYVSAYGILVGGNLAGILTNTSTGTISASAINSYTSGTAYAYGIYTSGLDIDANLSNNGTIMATAQGTGTSGGASAYGVYMWNSLGQNASLDNNSSITAQATGYNGASAYGINMFGMAADASLINNVGGSITATATATGGGASAYGISTGSLDAGATINNNGTITAQADGNSWAYAYGISMSGLGAGANLANGGTITANASGSSSYVSAYGISVGGNLAGTLTNTSTGTISASAINSYASGTAYAYGIYTSGLDIDANLTNNGTIMATAQGAGTSGGARAYGVWNSLGQNASLDNNGSITAQATGQKMVNAYGIYLSGMADYASLTNSGTITAQATGNSEASAYGIYLGGDLSPLVIITNNDTITASAPVNANAYSIYVNGPGSAGTVTNSGTLQGNLFLNGATNLTNTGTLALPAGVSGYIGGDYSQSASGLLQIGSESATSYAQLQVAGTATFAADSRIDVDVATVNTLATGQTLVDVVSAGTLAASTFAVTDNSTLFNFNAVIDGITVDLDIVTAISAVQSLMVTGNTAGLGAAQVFDDLLAGGTTGNADMDDVITALGTLTTEQEVSNAIDQTLPLLTGSMARAALDAMRDSNRVVQDRLEGWSGLSSGDELSSDRRVWLKPFGSWADQNARKNVAGFDSDTYGLMLGGETAMTGSSRLGAALAYSSSAVDSKSTVALQSADVTAYQVAVYGSHQLDSATGLDFIAGLGMNNTEGERVIDFGGLNRIARADYDSVSAHVGAGIGRAIEVGAAGTLVPSIRADYTRVRDESYTETGAGALNLDVDRHTTEELILSLAGKYKQTLSESLKFTAGLGVGYDFLNEQATITSAFVGGGAAFTTEGLEPSPWLVRGGLGLVMQLGQGPEFSVRYDAEAREDFLNQTASAKVMMSF